MPPKLILRHAVCTAVLALAASVSASAQVAHLVMQSQPGDYIGQGLNYNVFYTPADTKDGVFSAAASASVVGGQPDAVMFRFVHSFLVPFSEYDYASLDFSTKELGSPLMPGTYSDAQRAAFASLGHPGLEVILQDRGSNTLTGSFHHYGLHL